MAGECQVFQRRRKLAARQGQGGGDDRHTRLIHAVMRKPFQLGLDRRPLTGRIIDFSQQ
jgi:hypothetical protein